MLQYIQQRIYRPSLGRGEVAVAQFGTGADKAGLVLVQDSGWGAEMGMAVII